MLVRDGLQLGRRLAIKAGHGRSDCPLKRVAARVRRGVRDGQALKRRNLPDEDSTSPNLAPDGEFLSAHDGERVAIVFRFNPLTSPDLPDTVETIHTVLHLPTPRQATALTQV
jgi:hypothetical protein